jgi:hypothetical protein
MTPEGAITELRAIRAKGMRGTDTRHLSEAALDLAIAALQATEDDDGLDSP